MTRQHPNDDEMLARINDIARASYVQPDYTIGMRHWDHYRIDLAAEACGKDAEQEATNAALDAARDSCSRVSEAITASISESYADDCVTLLAGHGITDELEECAFCSVRTCTAALIDDGDDVGCVTCRERGADRRWVA